MRRFCTAIFLMTVTAGASLAQQGTLNPEEGGFASLFSKIAERPDIVGVTCWQIYEVQKGGQHADAFAAMQACAHAGNEPSMILLSHAYENGLGTGRNPELATFWVKQAALLGYVPAQYHYARALMDGYGVPQDSGQAQFWLMRAAMAGDQDAARLLRETPAS